MTSDDCERCRRGIVAVLAHELRNPLAALGNSLYVLKWSPPGGDKAQRAMRVIERQIGRLSVLITSLTDAAHIDQGRVELRRIVLDVGDTVRGAAQDREELFARHGLRLVLRVPDRPVPVLADPIRLEEVVGNLLDNAVRFTPAGGRVWLELEHDDRARRARIRVRDTGVGLDATMRRHLFEPFTQADTSLARTGGGLGLGLSLVKGLVELHGGSVTGDSEGLGRGSVFTVELPLASQALEGTAPP
jgi:signal transduction histidine kinase